MNPPRKNDRVVLQLFRMMAQLILFWLSSPKASKSAKVTCCLNQEGFALITLVFLLGLSMTAFLISNLNASSIQSERKQRTAAALAEAKAALLGFASNINLSASCAGGANCARPGDLPCPDMDNDGDAEVSCGSASGSTGQVNRLGRLPWKTLGLSDLRDGDGERLWYAVSSNYKNNYRYSPLNSDSVGTITLRTSDGKVLNNAASTSGLVAVIISAGASLVREDGVTQVRGTPPEQNNPLNYLDVALNEDNADFVDGSANGFILGKIKNSLGREIVNDQMLSISASEVNHFMESSVLSFATQELLDYYCGTNNVSYPTKSCKASPPSGSGFFPNPASFSNTYCLGYGDVTALCSSQINGQSNSTRGRLPVINSAGSLIFTGTSANNWFQTNGWRELIYYAVAQPCGGGTYNCTGGGTQLTLTPLAPPNSSKQVILIASGAVLGGKSRNNNVDKSFEVNYLEGENFSPLDDTYSITIPNNPSNNDRQVSLP